MKNEESALSWWMPSWGSLLVVGGSVLALFSLDEATTRTMATDSGLIQIMTGSTLAASCLLCLQRALRKVPPAGKWAELAYLSLMYALRECDFHRLFTDEHVTRRKLYTGPFPIEQKLIGGAIILLTLILVIHFAWRNTGHMVRCLRAGQSWAVHVCIWLFLGVGSQVLDKLDLISPHVDSIVEENLEFSAAVVFLLLLYKNPWKSADAEP